MQWEWRVFGSIPAEFGQVFDELPLARTWQQVRDAYFLLPTIDLNLKLRSGAEDGLKLKRCLRRADELELWTDRLDDLWLMPMRREELDALAADIGLELAPRERDWLDRLDLLDLLSQANPRAPVVIVDKYRTTHRLWEDEGAVLVEVVEISRPQRIQSIAIQNAFDLADEPEETIEAARETVQRAIRALGCEHGRWQACSYVEALRAWERGEEIRC